MTNNVPVPVAELEMKNTVVEDSTSKAGEVVDTSDVVIELMGVVDDNSIEEDASRARLVARPTDDGVDTLFKGRPGLLEEVTNPIHDREEGSIARAIVEEGYETPAVAEESEELPGNGPTDGSEDKNVSATLEPSLEEVGDTFDVLEEGESEVVEGKDQVTKTLAGLVVAIEIYSSVMEVVEICANNDESESEFAYAEVEGNVDMAFKMLPDDTDFGVLSVISLEIVKEYAVLITLKDESSGDK